MEYDYVITKPELNEDTLKHYGVMGMRWGIRKDIRKTGSISKKTKSKIKEAARTAKYGKHRRMLNGLEQLKADYKGDYEYHRSSNNKAGMKEARKNLGLIDSVSSGVRSESKKKGYKYDVKKGETRPTRRAMQKLALASNVGQILAGPIGNIALYSGTGYALRYKDKKHTDQYKTSNSQYYVRDTDVYKRVKKKK